MRIFLVLFFVFLNTFAFAFPSILDDNYFLQSRFYFDQKDSNECRDFLRAVFKADYDLTRNMLQKNRLLSSSCRDQMGNNAAHIFAQSTKAKDAIFLLINPYGHAQSRLGEKNILGYTPLMTAVLEDNVRAVLLLLCLKFQNNSPDLSAQNINGFTAFHMAILGNNEKILSAFRAQYDQIEIDQISSSKNTALHFAVALNNIKLIQFLLEKGAKTEIRNAMGLIPLELAIAMRSASAARLLLKNGEHYALDEFWQEKLNDVLQEPKQKPNPPLDFISNVEEPFREIPLN